MTISLEDAKNLRFGEYLMRSDNTRWKVNGAVKTWKTDASRIRVPLKYGLYVYAALTTSDFNTAGVCDHFSKET